MRYASVLHRDVPMAVAVDAGRALPLPGIPELGPDTPLRRLRATRPDAAGAIPLAELTYRPVVPAPARIICVGLNYAAHVEETHREVPEYPVLFTKFASALIGPYDGIVRPPESAAVDYEGELAVVIGEPARRIAPADALDVVAGLTVANDVTMRDFQYRSHQWLQGKAWDATTPLGPELVTLDEVSDPRRLRLRTILGDEVVQDASTELMMFPIPVLVSVISQFTALAPGDVILTGTPSGVGFRREPPRLLEAGDVVAVEIEGVGRIENEVVEEVLT